MLCPKCGAENAEGSNFCHQCGEALATGVSKPKAGSTGLEANVAGLLCYVLGWITGLIFFLLEKEDKLVRFHAMQSIVTFGAFTAVFIVLSILEWLPLVGVLFLVLESLIGILAFVLWIVLMIKAYQGERYKLPWAGDFAERYT